MAQPLVYYNYCKNNSNCVQGKLSKHNMALRYHVGVRRACLGWDLRRAVSMETHREAVGYHFFIVIRPLYGEFTLISILFNK